MCSAMKHSESARQALSALTRINTGFLPNFTLKQYRRKSSMIKLNFTMIMLLLLHIAAATAKTRSLWTGRSTSGRCAENPAQPSIHGSFPQCRCPGRVISRRPEVRRGKVPCSSLMILSVTAMLNSAWIFLSLPGRTAGAMWTA